MKYTRIEHDNVGMSNGLKATQRPGVQLPQAHDTGSRQNSTDLAREAVSWNAMLGCRSIGPAS